MKTVAKTVKEYLAALPKDRRDAVEQVRQIILKKLPKGYEEGLSFGLISYEVPLSVCPDTYNGKPLMYAALGSQKNYMTVHLMGAYGSPEIAETLREGFAKAGKKLDMGKACIRFKSVDDLALDAIGKTVSSLSVKEYVAYMMAARSGAAKKTAAKKASKKSK